MARLLVKLPQEKREVEAHGLSVAEVLEKFSSITEYVAARYNGRLVDLSFRPQEDGEIEPVYEDSSEGLEIIRHSASHVMAQAVKELFPQVSIAIGPATEEGFYYDFEREESFSTDDLVSIEGRMEEIVKRDLPLIRQELSRDEAISFFEEAGEKYKVEILKEIAEPAVSL